MHAAPAQFRPSNAISSVNDLLSFALERIQVLDLPAAQRSLRESLVSYPEEGRLWELLGTVLWAEGDLKEALAAIETASVYRPLGPFAQIILADCYAREGKANLAFMILYFLTEEDRCPTEILPHLAASLGNIQAYYLAYLICARLIERVPDDHAAYFGMAYYHVKDGHLLEDALPFLTRAFELNPFSLTYRLNYGLALAELGDTSEAKTLLGQINPQQITCTNSLDRLSHFFKLIGDKIRVDLYQARLLELSL
ncbi:MAG: tetratricopeptide repeat protein [Gemmatales bacterium]